VNPAVRKDPRSNSFGFLTKAPGGKASAFFCVRWRPVYTAAL